jgi:hypothetical protein
VEQCRLYYQLGRQVGGQWQISGVQGAGYKGLGPPVMVGSNTRLEETCTVGLCACSIFLGAQLVKAQIQLWLKPPAVDAEKHLSQLDEACIQQHSTNMARIYAATRPLGASSTCSTPKRLRALHTGVFTLLLDHPHLVGGPPPRL